MAGPPFALVEAFHALRPQPHGELRLDQRLGHRGVMPCHCHRVVAGDTSLWPRGLGGGLGGPRPEGRAVEGRNQRLACPGEFRAGTGMQGRPKRVASRLDLREGEARVVPEPGPQPTCHDVDPNCPLGLRPRLGGARREDGTARRLRQRCGGAMELGCIAVGPGHGRLQGSGADDRGDPTEDRHGPPMGTDPVGQPLRPGGVGVGIMGGP
jgi:hypothetical protein